MKAPASVQAPDPGRGSEAEQVAVAASSALEVQAVTKTFPSTAGPLRRLIRRRSRGQDASRTAARGKGKTVVAVDAVSFRVERGEIFGVLGPNGTGKSTLVRLISTLLLPDSGAIRVFGLDVEEDDLAVKRLINRVSVDAAFFKKLSAMENLMYAARLYGVPVAGARKRALEILADLGLEEEPIWQPMENMSRGMQQKVAIARAFLTAPVLLLLDEPTTGLDPRSKRDVQAFVRRIRDDHKATILLTTHDMAEAEALCDRIAIIDRGGIVALDTPGGLKAQVSVNGAAATLEDVFLELTGRKLKTEE